jgi:ribosome maturation factor RimP
MSRIEVEWASRPLFVSPETLDDREEAAVSAPEQAVRRHAEELASAAGLDLVDVALKGQGPRQLVRVAVDQKGGVDLASCQELSKRLSERLDEEDVIPGTYTLEVTSPGVTYPLQGRRAFDRVEGRLVRILRSEAGELRGTVVAADDEAVVVDVDGEQVRVPYEEIQKATQALPW